MTTIEASHSMDVIFGEVPQLVSKYLSDSLGRAERIGRFCDVGVAHSKQRGQRDVESEEFKTIDTRQVGKSSQRRQLFKQTNPLNRQRGPMGQRQGVRPGGAGGAAPGGVSGQGQQGYGQQGQGQHQGGRGMQQGQGQFGYGRQQRGYGAQGGARGNQMGLHYMAQNRGGPGGMQSGGNTYGPGGYGNMQTAGVRTRDWSVAPRTHWREVDEMGQVSLCKAAIDPTKVVVTDSCRTGVQQEYSRELDKASWSKPRDLAPSHKGVTFKFPRTSTDSKMEELVMEELEKISGIEEEEIVGQGASGSGQKSSHLLRRVVVGATESVLTALMCCPRASASFDLVVTRQGPLVLIDARELGQQAPGSSSGSSASGISLVDLMSINETGGPSIQGSGSTNQNSASSQSENADGSAASQSSQKAKDLLEASSLVGASIPAGSYDPALYSAHATDLNLWFQQSALAGERKVLGEDTEKDSNDSESKKVSGVSVYRVIKVPASSKIVSAGYDSTTSEGADSAASQTGSGSASVEYEMSIVFRGEASGSLGGDELVQTRLLVESDLLNGTSVSSGGQQSATSSAASSSSSSAWVEAFRCNRDAAVFATEVKNNAFKMARWVTGSMLSGVNCVKFGYAVKPVQKKPSLLAKALQRQTEESSSSASAVASIIGVQTYNTEDLFRQLALSKAAVWSTVGSILGRILKDSDSNLDESGAPSGKYVVIKDPSRPCIKIFSVPFDEFEKQE